MPSRRSPSHGVPSDALRRAFDEARFGAARTLNLRAALPTTWEATVRADAWLRQQQAAGTPEVLVITGRGKGSAGGVSPVRTAIVRLLASLQRRGVVASVREHTPGSFVVRLAPFRAQRPAPRATPPGVIPAPDPRALAGLAPDTRALLRQLAVSALTALGVRDVAPHVEEEMLRQFARVVADAGEGDDREARLRDAIRAAIERYDDER